MNMSNRRNRVAHTERAFPAALSARKEQFASILCGALIAYMMSQVVASDDFFIDAVSSDLRYVVVKNTGTPRFKNQKFYFWDMSKRAMLSELLCKNESSAVRCVEVRPDNRAVLVDGKRMLIYDFGKQISVRTMILDERITACAVDNNQQYAVIAEFVEHWVSGERVTSVVDVRDSRVIGKADWYSSGVLFCRFINNQGRAIACDLSGTIAVIDCQTMKAKNLAQKCNAIPNSMVTQNGQVLIAGIQKGKVRSALIHVTNANDAKQLCGHVKPVFAAAFIGDKSIITTDDGGVSCLWNIDGSVVKPKTLIKRAPEKMVRSGLLAGDAESGIVYVCENVVHPRGREYVTTAILTILDIKNLSCVGRYVFGETLVSEGTARVCEFTTDGISAFSSEPMK